MKSFHIVIFSLLTISTNSSFAEAINDATLVHYYQAGKNAYESQNWFDALRYFYTYKEMSSINTSTTSKLSPQDVDKFISYSKMRINTPFSAASYGTKSIPVATIILQPLEMQKVHPQNVIDKDATQIQQKVELSK